jgi:hypothetical protein
MPPYFTSFVSYYQVVYVTLTGYGFIDHLYTPLETANNYSAVAKASPACNVFTRRFLAIASSSGDSSASRAYALAG